MCLGCKEATNAVPLKRATPSSEITHRSPLPMDTPNLQLHMEQFPLKWT